MTETDTRLSLTSADVTAERRAALRELFPEAFSEDGIDYDRLRQALGDETAPPGRERYGLSWAGKADAIRAVQTLSTGTLAPAPEESVSFDTTENLFIEGDNLEVLKLLQKSYHGKVKMIYIDPPYNTGNEFIYPDNFAEGLQSYLRYSGQVDDTGLLLTTNAETSGRYHSKWLSMMYPRLSLARHLLRDDGVIFVSIDDHEVHNLRLLMNEIFGEENFVTQITAQTNPRGRTLDRFIAKTHEYILVFARDVNQDCIREIPKSDAALQAYNKRDDQGAYRELERICSINRGKARAPATSASGQCHRLWPSTAGHTTGRLGSLSRSLLG